MLCTYRATCSPLRLGRVLPTMPVRVIGCSWWCRGSAGRRRMAVVCGAGSAVLQAGLAGDGAELAPAVVLEGLVDLGLAGHDEGAAHGDGLADRLAAEGEHDRGLVAVAGLQGDRGRLPAAHGVGPGG